MLGFNIIRLPFRYRDLDEQYPKDYVSAAVGESRGIHACVQACILNVCRKVGYSLCEAPVS